MQPVHCSGFLFGLFESFPSHLGSFQIVHFLPTCSTRILSAESELILFRFKRLVEV